MGTFLVDHENEEIALEPDIRTNIMSKRRAGARTVGSLQVVEFILGNELFAIDLFDTREVINFTEITSLPNSPLFIKGIIDLRGVITTIIDLKEMMHIGNEATGRNKSRIIVLDHTVSEKMIGVLVDDVLAVTTFTDADIDRDAQSSKNNGCDILGIIRKKTRTEDKDKNELIIWLDIRTIIKKIETDL